MRAHIFKIKTMTEAITVFHSFCKSYYKLLFHKTFTNYEASSTAPGKWTQLK